MSAHLRTRTHVRGHQERKRRPPCRLGVEPLEDRCLMTGDVVLEWNQLFLQSIRTQVDQPATVHFQRHLAMMHAAMFDAVNAIERSYTPYAADVRASRGASTEAAAAQAAHDTLAALYPSQQAAFDAALAADLEGIPPGQARQGIAVGRAVAEQILDWRSNDGWYATPPLFLGGTEPGEWRPTPPALSPAMFTHWPGVTPFAIASSDRFLPGPRRRWRVPTTRATSTRPGS